MSNICEFIHFIERALNLEKEKEDLRLAREKFLQYDQRELQQKNSSIDEAIMLELTRVQRKLIELTKIDYFLKQLNKILVCNMSPDEMKKLMYDLERSVLRDNTWKTYRDFKQVLT